MEQIQIDDQSNDRKYFTIIPNYVLNHSTLYDREVYIQMKRKAGEYGTCWTSQKNLANQCGISINRLKKSIKYLTKNKWIEYMGKKIVKTSGGNQEVNEYKIIDLWQLNNKHYQGKGVSPDDTPTTKGVSPDDDKGCHENAKGVSPGDDKEEPLKKNPIKKNPKTASEACGLDKINELMNLFYKLNPGLNFGNTTQRGAASFLIKKFGFDNARRIIEYACQIQGERYAPVITTPLQLKNKLGDLNIYQQKEKARGDTAVINLNE